MNAEFGWSIAVIIFAFLLGCVALGLYVHWKNRENYTKDYQIIVWSVAIAAFALLIVGVGMMIWAISKRKDKDVSKKALEQQQSLEDLNPTVVDTRLVSPCALKNTIIEAPVLPPPVIEAPVLPQPEVIFTPPSLVVEEPVSALQLDIPISDSSTYSSSSSQIGQVLIDDSISVEPFRVIEDVDMFSEPSLIPQDSIVRDEVIFESPFPSPIVQDVRVEDVRTLLGPSSSSDLFVEASETLDGVTIEDFKVEPIIVPKATTSSKPSSSNDLFVEASKTLGGVTVEDFKVEPRIVPKAITPPEPFRFNTPPERTRVQNASAVPSVTAPPEPFRFNTPPERIVPETFAGVEYASTQILPQNPTRPARRIVRAPRRRNPL